jgi:hypothetical protein
LAIRTYWSNTKFANRVRGTEKPWALTSGEWREWNKKAKLAHPIRYWVAETFLDSIQTTLNWPTDRLYDIKYYCLNRWKTKSHALTSNLPRGKWYDYDTRILHSLFDELVNFVEIELAWVHIAWDAEARKKYKVPFWGVGWFKTRTWRSAEVGIEHLKWAMSMGDQHGASSKEILDLYIWWTKLRPTRLDPHDASGWSAICDAARSKDDFGFDMPKTAKERKQTTAALDKCSAIEEIYRAEDDAMLIRLIKVRHEMWT